LRPKAPQKTDGKLRVKANMRRKEYLEAVKKTKAYVRSGDIIQAVISQRLEVQETVDPFSLYRSLRLVNPSPYMFFLQYPHYALVGSSPEVLVRVVTGSAGARRRDFGGSSPDRGHPSPGGNPSGG